VICDSLIANQLWRATFYLTGKPSFFGANTWPWVDPTAGTIYTLPAKARYNAGTPNTVP
jgi:hypothetical protein